MISKFIYTKILGWKLVGEFPTDLKKYVVIGAPHTSWKDFPIAILARNSWGTKINYIGKKSLFKPPFGFIFKWLGGAPVDRSKSNNLVDAIIKVFDSKDEFRLALSPEGTRQKVDKWKTGFYYIAKGAGVPIVMFTLDFGRKQVAVSEPFYPTDNMEKDIETIKSFYNGVVGANPNLQ
ncbi:acyltransferase [Tenacibaculum holothuriorum]|uniref:Acyltransferase n=1 Tax=Tenacibaculum holothuriorum TaxID=1635173 RepID=A0A1Y2PFX7_9FLAO|nr:lysophospholipid acyltransferase family protein [Tenacibaculum holothuriorum]OSY89335.1 acyltransferase [Tenacibaculum holothuriorum]